jgi:hypothetical protein
VATITDPPVRSGKPVGLSLRAAAMKAGVSQHRFLKLCALGKVRPILELGTTTKYDASDVEALAVELGK